MSVVLPLCEAPATSVLPEEHESARGAAKILVVDDNEDAADTCAMLLDLHGYEVQVAYTPDAALQLLKNGFTPDVAILDIGLPGMNGYTLALRMQAAPIGYPGRLIALTGYGQAADMAASKAAGFDAHLTKPVSPEELLELVARLAQEAADNLSSSADNRS
jgi:CheY-like chemotaxis protein